MYFGVMSWAGQDGPAWLRSVSTLTIGGVGVQAPQRGENVGQELVLACGRKLSVDSGKDLWAAFKLGPFSRGLRLPHQTWMGICPKLGWAWPPRDPGLLSQVPMGVGPSCLCLALHLTELFQRLLLEGTSSFLNAPIKRLSFCSQ